jgi:hypothetical protein
VRQIARKSKRSTHRVLRGGGRRHRIPETDTPLANRGPRRARSAGLFSSAIGPSWKQRTSTVQRARVLRKGLGALSPEGPISFDFIKSEDYWSISATATAAAKDGLKLLIGQSLEIKPWFLIFRNRVPPKEGVARLSRERLSDGRLEGLQYRRQAVLGVRVLD